MLQGCRSLGVKDDRDRVYAFLGLPVARFITQDGRFSPSYSKDVLDVYREFASCYIRHAPEHPLRLLHHVDYHDDLHGGQPSWVPMWHRHTYVNKVEILCTGSEVIVPAPPQTEYHFTLKDRALTCAALILDTIVDASPVFDQDSSTLADLARAWRHYGREYSTRKRLVYEHPLLAYINLIRCGRQSPSDSAERMKKQLRAWAAVLEGACVEGSGEAPDWWEKKVCLQRLTNRHIAVTERGYFCLLPASAQAGDLCCILYGTELPFILRRAGPPGSFRLIGVAYMVSNQCREYPFGWDYLRFGKGQLAYEEWLDLGIENEQITLI